MCVGGTLEATLDCLSFEVGSLLYIIPFHVGTKRGSGINVMMPQLQRYVVMMLGRQSKDYAKQTTLGVSFRLRICWRY